MSFPSVLNTFSRPTPSDKLNSPSHSALHNTVSSALGQVEAVIGVEGADSVVGTLQYLVKSPASDGGGHIQTAAKGGTGQTSFTKGDLLVAQSASVLSKLAVGTDGHSLVADSTTNTGVKWGLPGAAPTVRVYQTSSSVYTWNRPSTLTYAVIEVQGNGGNGGAGADGAGTGGGGGGGGGYAKKVIPFASLPIAASILVQSGGAGSILSYFGSILQAVGGQNGTGRTPGTGGTATGGDINILGGGGMPGDSGGGGVNGGNGGGAVLGNGASGGLSGVGSVAGNYGGGGGGGAETSDSAGGTGGNAVVLITEY